MATTSFQRVMAIVCVLAFGLGQAMLAPVMVRCTDATGTARLEYACLKAGGGGCGADEPSPASMDGGERGSAEEGVIDAGDSNPPCDDVPLAQGVGAARFASATPSIDAFFAVALGAIVSDQWSWRDWSSPRGVAPHRAMQRPADWPLRARAIVLNV